MLPPSPCPLASLRLKQYGTSTPCFSESAMAVASPPPRRPDATVQPVTPTAAQPAATPPSAHPDRRAHEAERDALLAERERILQSLEESERQLG